MELRMMVITIIKLFGLYLVVSTIVQTFSYLPIYFSNWDDVPGIHLISPFFTIVIGLCFWFLPVTIANTIVSPEPIYENQDRFFPELEKIGIVLLGLYLLYFGITSFASHYLTDSKMYELLGNEYQRTVRDHVSFYTALIQVIVSILIILGAKPIGNFIRWVWKTGKRWPSF